MDLNVPSAVQGYLRMDIVPSDLISPLAPNLTKNSVQDKHSAINVLHALLCLISLTVFDFSHLPILSAQLLILSTARLPAPDF